MSIEAAVWKRANEEAAGRRSRVRALVRSHPEEEWRATIDARGPLGRQVVPTLHRGHRIKAVVRKWMGRGRAVAT
jgi:hypothetical protein